VSALAGVLLCGGPRPGPILAPVDYQERYRWCCAGAAEWGPGRCTCWDPVYDLEQAEPRTDEVPETRSQMCGDCAYRPDSPERQADPYGMIGLPNFWCHRGMRRPKEWRHPDGRVRRADPANYQPPIVDGVAYRADGHPAARCGGWAAEQRELAAV
jgi:hypothetical protein